MADTDSLNTSKSDVLSSYLSTIKKRWFLVGVVIVIVCANLYPPLGSKTGQSCNTTVFIMYMCIVLDIKIIRKML